MGQSVQERWVVGGWVGGSGPEGSDVAHLGDNLGDISVRSGYFGENLGSGRYWWMDSVRSFGGGRDQYDVGVVIHNRS